MNKIINIVEKGCFLVGIIGGTTSMIIFIVVIGLIKSCVGSDVDPIDNSYMTQRECYNRKILTDSTGIGFELLWYTTKPVTEKRMEEIKTRKPIQEAQQQLMEEAPEHFKHNFFHTDIHDFAKYAVKFDVDSDVRLVNIFIYGQRLKEQYWLPNPDLPDGGCTKPAYGTDQGTLYLKEDDIYDCNPEAGSLYRYWRCWRTSTKDERYTHFTTSERIQQ